MGFRGPRFLRPLHRSGVGSPRLDSSRAIPIRPRARARLRYRTGPCCAVRRGSRRPGGRARSRPRRARDSANWTGPRHLRRPPHRGASREPGPRADPLQHPRSLRGSGAGSPHGRTSARPWGMHCVRSGQSRRAVMVSPSLSVGAKTRTAPRGRHLGSHAANPRRVGRPRGAAPRDPHPLPAPSFWTTALRRAGLPSVTRFGPNGSPATSASPTVFFVVTH